MSGTLVSRLRSNFSAKLLVVLLVIGVFVGVTGGVIYVQTADALESDTKSELTRSAEIQASQIAEWTQRNHDHVRAVANRDELKAEDPDRVEAMLTTEASRLSESADGIHYIDVESGRVLSSSIDGAAGTSYSDVRWMKSDGYPSGPDNSTLTTMYTDPVTGKDAAAFVAAVPDSERLVVIPIDLAERSDELERPVDDSDAFTVVVNSEGYVALSHMDGGINEQNMGDSETAEVDSMAVMRGLEGESGYMEMEMGGERMTMGYAPIEGSDWVLMTHFPAEDAFALQGFVQNAVLGLTLVSFLGLGAVGIVVGRNTTRSLRDLATTAQEIKNGDIEAELSTERTDEIGQLYDSFDAMRVSLKESLQAADSAKQEAKKQADEAAKISNHLEEKAEEYRTEIEAAANGDLTRRLNAESESQAMRDIGSAFNEMIADIENVMTEIQTVADTVADSTTDVETGADEIRQASETVSESIEQIAIESDEQRETVNEVATEISQLSATIEEVSSTATTVAETSQETAEIAADGEATAEGAIENMADVQTTMKSAVENIEELEGMMEEIDEIVAVIGEIAEQTNILALNANIEAARAGDSGTGDGFAVVAEEVKQLAEETQSSAEDVAELIEDVQNTTETTVTGIRDADEQVRKTSESVDRAANAFVTVSGNVAETNDGIQEISDAMDDQATNVQEIVTVVEDMETRTESTAEGTDSVSAAAEEQATSVSEVDSNITTLVEQIERLRTLIETFETDSDGAVGDPTESETASEDVASTD
jgi:methyl-accepting chemotaxis protein